jgi:hypothetical protein
MANAEHLEKLKRGVLEWNTWRYSNAVTPDLHDADLSGANLSDANLNGSDATGVYLWETIFADVNLSNVTGLDQCRHGGPSTIDHRTLARSEHLPLSFLRGCGVPDMIIGILPALRGSVIDRYSCFISYSSKDQTFVNRLYADLQSKGVRCWLASEDLKTGDRTRSAIFEAIRTREKLLVVLSAHSIASTWVASEVEEALAEEAEQPGRLILFLIILDDAAKNEPSAWARTLRNERHITDFSNWADPEAYTRILERLLRDLAKPSR